MPIANSNSSRGKNGRRAKWFAALLGFIGVASDGLALGASPAAAQTETPRSAADVPAAWRNFAHDLQERFAKRMAANGATVSRLAEEMARGGKGSGASAAPRMVTVRAWVSLNGTIERLEFDGLDGDAANALRAVLGEGDVGMPPLDMLQPVRLRLSLRPAPRQEPEK